MTAMLDFPTAWRLVRRGLIHTDRRCSYIQTWGGMLCDCGAVDREWHRMIAQGFLLGLVEADFLKTPDCPCLYEWRSLGRLYGISMGKWVRMAADSACPHHGAKP